ncbi:MAG TPA: ATP-binding protein, partial [Anaeromyxobacteraceae bacterium]|nr:ATP-binding protein [Anaeromyxobacteraceae bacterium]
IGQAVSNLLGNAIEHGMPGRPVAVTVTGTDDKLLIISVHNEGTISDEVRATLFDPFQRAQRKDRPRTGGLGLGLYVSERIATAHDGAIAVDSSPEHGTTFSIRLPRCASGAQHR